MHSKVSKLRVKLARELRGRILDCGSGDDLFGHHLRRPGNAVVSFDLDLSALSATPGARVLGSCAALPFKDNSFDALWSCAIIEHVVDDTLPEMVRVTRPGGRMIVVTPNRRSPYDPLKKLCGLGTWWDNEGHVRLYSIGDLRPFGDVHGETWWVPGAGWLFWRLPLLSHVLVLDCEVTQALKERLARS